MGADDVAPIIKRLWASEHIPEAKKEELAKRHDAGTLNAVMLGVLIESYEEEAREQTEQSDDAPTEEDAGVPSQELQHMGSTSEAVLVPPLQQNLPIEEQLPPEPQDTPLLVSAADLADDDEEIPPPPEHSLPPPPGESFGLFHVDKGRFGPGTWGVDILHGDGTYEPVMVYLAREHPEWDGPTVGSWLQQNGLPQDLAVRLGRQRQGQQEGVVVAVHHPAVSQLSENEAKHYAEKDAFSRAFLEAQRNKKKGAPK